MNIGLLVPILGMKHHREIYLSILSFLEKKGHHVVHPFGINEKIIERWTDQKNYRFFYDYYSKASKCDIILAECTFPCTHIGYEIAGVVQQGKNVIILKAKNAESPIQYFDPLYKNNNIYIYEYMQHNLLDILKEALDFNPNQKYKKYNILFTPTMVAKLNSISRKHNLPKSVYIRQLVEKGLEEES